jgi:hypothetical protein
MMGCTSSRTAEEIAADRARVLGTWTYRTDNISALQRGTLRISVHDGKLVGRIQDTWRGALDARVYLRGAHLELQLDRVQITGDLVDDRFKGLVHQPIWEGVRGDPWRGSTGYFVARRVRRESTADEHRDFGCPSLLRESSYACSPFGSP